MGGKILMYASIDIETTGLNRYKDEITFIGIELHKSIDSPALKVYIFDWSNPKDRSRFKQIVKKLKEHRVKCIWQNGKFDTLFIAVKTGIYLPIHEDIMLMGTSYDLAAEHGLKKMAQNYLGVEDWDIKTKEKTSKSKEIVEPYLKCDIKYTWELFVYFTKVMSESQMKIYKKLLLPAYKMYRKVEDTGIYINLDDYQEVKDKYADIEADKLGQLNKKYNINWNSAPQKQKVLFDKSCEGLPILKLTPAGKPSADASVCKKLASMGYEIPQLIIDFSAANTLNKMFLNRWEEDASYDGRIHPSFNLTNVISGRTSCSNPNLQQVPRTKDVRGLFTAPEGRVFFEADYSQLELRIAAHYAKEPTMLKTYASGGDIHTETAKVMTGGREPTKEERGKAKAVNFGFLYGMTAKKFVEYAYNSYGQTFTQAEAEAYRNAFFAKYSRLLPWHKEQEEICEMMGGVSNMFGRFRKLPKIYSNQKFERLEAVRRAINTPVQGTGSDILLSAALEVQQTLGPYGLKIVGTVHDSILGEMPEEDADWMVEEIHKIMAHPKLLDEFGVELSVALEADVGVGPWGTH